MLLHLRKPFLANLITRGRGSRLFTWNKHFRRKYTALFPRVASVIIINNKKNYLSCGPRNIYQTICSPYSKIYSQDEGNEDYPFELEDFTDEHLKIQLYPNETDQSVTKLYNANSLQEIFDTVESIQPEKLNEKHTSQALVSIWDLQKLLYKISVSFDPDFDNRTIFIDQVNGHPTFNSIVQHVVKNCHLLEDEPLAASLLSFKKLNHNLDSSECQALLQECLKRKENLALPAVSRITVCLRNESQSLLMINFIPCLFHHVSEMNDDLSVRLVSISLRNVQHFVTNTFLEAYRQRIGQLLIEDKLNKFETVTLCKILLCIYETSREMNLNYRCEDLYGPFHLIRQIGTILADRTDNMEILDLLNLQKFLEFGPQEPRKLTTALIKKVSRLIEEEDETPLLDLLHCYLPAVKNITTRSQLSVFARNYLEQCKDFGAYALDIAKILKVLKINEKDLFTKFWLKAENHIKTNVANVRWVLRFTQDYLTFVRVNYGAFRNYTFETTAKQILYSYIRNYRNGTQPSVIGPGSMARVYSFIIAFATPMEPIFNEVGNEGLISFLDNQFADNLKILDLVMLSRGIETCNSLKQYSRRHYPSKYFNQILDLISIVDERFTTKLLKNDHDISGQDLNLICRAQTALNKGESPIFQEAVQRFRLLPFEQLNSKSCRDIVVTLLTATYNEPTLLRNVKNYIRQCSEYISADLALKFVFLAYTLGYESSGQEDDEVFQICCDIVSKYWTQFGSLELLQAMQALCYYRTLDTDLVQQVFSVQFLDQVDEELNTSVANVSNPVKVRLNFMELNRAVCIDLPQAQVPWFHEKFCENVRAGAGPPKTTQIHNEVYSVLCEILNKPDYIQRNCYSPYSYDIDFLIEFDEKGRPIKKTPTKRSLFSFKKPELNTEVAEKVAILVLPERSFTKNVRSLRGYSKLRNRHLEMLGYRVVLVDPLEWNSMYMSIPTVKNDYLEQCIYAKKEAKN